MASSPVIMRIGPSGDSSKTKFNEHRCNMLKFRLEHAGYRVIVEHADNLAIRTVVLLHRGRIVAKCEAVESVIPKTEVERLLRAVDSPQPRVGRKRLRRKPKPKPEPESKSYLKLAQDSGAQPDHQKQASPPPPPPARQSAATADTEAISSVNALDLHRRLEELSVAHENGQANYAVQTAKVSTPSTNQDAVSAPAAIDGSPSVPAGLGTTWALVPFGSVKNSDLAVLQTMKTPPQPVYDVLHVVCLLIGAAKPFKGSSVRSAKQSISDFDWDMARRVMAQKREHSLLRCMMRFDPSELDMCVRKCAEQLLAHEHMTVSAVKRTSAAAQSLLTWAMAACQTGTKASKGKAQTRLSVKCKARAANKANLDSKRPVAAATAAVKVKLRPKVATKPIRTVKTKPAAKTPGRAAEKSSTVAKSPQRQGHASTTLHARAHKGIRVRRSHSGTGLMLSVSISKHDLVELRAMCNPPQGIKDVVEVVLLLLGEDLHTVSDTWARAKKVLGSTLTFQKRLASFTGGAELSAYVLRRVRRLMAQKHLTIETMRGKSMAACSLLQWALDAMMTCPPATALSPDVGRGGLPATAACSIAAASVDPTSNASAALKTKKKKKKLKKKTKTTMTDKAYAQAKMQHHTSNSIVVETAAAAEAAIKPKRKAKRKSAAASESTSANTAVTEAAVVNDSAGFNGVLPLRADATRHILEGFIKARMPKSHVLELGNGLGGGSIVRQGKPFLDAYAEALRIPRGALIDALRMAPGDLEEWATVMEPHEVREINDLDTK